MLTIIETIHVIVKPNYIDCVTQLALGKLIFDIIPFSLQNKTAFYNIQYQNRKGYRIC